MIIFWFLMGVVAILLGFIILQRRRPEEADRIAAGLDAAVKKAETAAKDQFDKLTRKGK